MTENLNAKVSSIVAAVKSWQLGQINHAEMLRRADVTTKGSKLLSTLTSISNPSRIEEVARRAARAGN